MSTLILAALLSAAPAETNAHLAEQVRQTETAFAKTMADRDHAAFVSFLADEAVFFGRDSVQHGKAEVAQAWKPLYQAMEAPFSWRPKTVEVLASGTLALSSGPVFDPSGRHFGDFTSIWRREADGKWRIIFDKGCDVCSPPSPKP